MLARHTERRDCGFTPKLNGLGKRGDVRIAESAACLYSLLLVWRESVIHINQNIGVGGHLYTSHSCFQNLPTDALESSQNRTAGRPLLTFVKKGLTQGRGRTTF